MAITHRAYDDKKEKGEFENYSNDVMLYIHIHRFHNFSWVKQIGGGDEYKKTKLPTNIFSQILDWR